MKGKALVSFSPLRGDCGHATLTGMKQYAAFSVPSALLPYALAVALAFGPSLPALATDAPPAIAMPPSLSLSAKGAHGK